MGRKADRRQGSVAEYPGWIITRRAAGGRRPSNAESIGTCARALTQVATQAVITQAIPCVPSRWIQAKSVRCPAQVRNFRVARDSAGTQTGQTGIVSCDRLVSTTIYPIRGLPINELYTSGPCRPLIRYPSEANLSVIFRSKVE